MERIIIDTDPGVDDAFAIMLALYAKDLRIEGITTVEGNGTLEQVSNNALRILKAAGRLDVKVYKGCSLKDHDTTEVKEIHGKDALGDVPDYLPGDAVCEDEHAVDFIIRTVREHPHEITLATLGPLENIAQAIQKAPDIVRLLKRIVIMGGAVKGGNITHNAEANIYNAPEAAAAVFSSGIGEIVMVGLDATTQFLFDANLREILRQLDTPVSTMLYRISRIYTDFYWESDCLPGFIPHDVLVILYLMDPRLIRTVDARVTVVHEGGDSHGHTAADTDSPDPNVKACMGLEYDEAVDLFFSTVFPDEVDPVRRALSRLRRSDS